MLIGLLIAIALYYKVSIPTIKLEAVKDRYESARTSVEAKKKSASTIAKAKAAAAASRGRSSSDSDEVSTA